MHRITHRQPREGPPRGGPQFAPQAQPDAQHAPPALDAGDEDEDGAIIDRSRSTSLCPSGQDTIVATDDPTSTMGRSSSKREPQVRQRNS